MSDRLEKALDKLADSAYKQGYAKALGDVLDFMTANHALTTALVMFCREGSLNPPEQETEEERQARHNAKSKQLAFDIAKGQNTGR